jgi:hypothetical protein
MAQRITEVSIQSLRKGADTKTSASEVAARSFSKMKFGLSAMFFLLMIVHLRYNDPTLSHIHLEVIEEDRSAQALNGVSFRSLRFDNETAAVEEKMAVDALFAAAPANIKPKATIAYATSVTKCTKDSVLMDQASVLMYSIHKSSFRVPTSGSRYDYDLFVFLHTEAAECKDQLEKIGWTVLIKDTPVEVEEIRGNLKQYVKTASCCGEKEFLKLYSYTLTDYPVVVHFDLDVIVLQNMDELYDSMIDGPSSPARSKVAAMWQQASEFPENIEGFFTRDYNMVMPGQRRVHQIGVQGGFIIVKPNLNYFEEYRQIIIEGNYTVAFGWGDKLAYGGFYGAAQIQGLCSYFFGHMRPNTTIELNRCIYNSMADNPHSDLSGLTRCRTMQPLEECEDCRLTKVSLIKTAHLTVCQKPWGCQAYEGHPQELREKFLAGKEAYPICSQMHNAWFKFRQELEYLWSSRNDEYGLQTASMTQKFPLATPKTVSTTLGFCARNTGGNIAYISMKHPNQKIDLKAL